MLLFLLMLGLLVNLAANFLLAIKWNQDPFDYFFLTFIIGPFSLLLQFINRPRKAIDNL